MSAWRGRGRATRSVVWARGGMVSAAQPLAVEAGIDTLRRGGSAADAAIAVNASDWGRASQVHARMPGFAEIFLPHGRAPRQGETFANPALGRTLSTLAEGGRDEFYAGRVAETLVAFSTEHGGFFALSDLARSHATWDAPISTDYRGDTVWELP